MCFDLSGATWKDGKKCEEGSMARVMVDITIEGLKFTNITLK